jgi:hypothetical protein
MMVMVFSNFLVQQFVLVKIRDAQYADGLFGVLIVEDPYVDVPEFFIY